MCPLFRLAGGAHGDLSSADGSTVFGCAEMSEGAGDWLAGIHR